MALLLTNVQNQINEVQNKLTFLSEDITSIRDAISSGTTGTDTNGNSTITYIGQGGIPVTILSSVVSTTLASAQQTQTDLTNQLSDLKNQIPLASTVDTPNARLPDPTVLRNYQHASRIFVDANYRLSPKYGFLFYVEFDFNPMISNVSNTAAQEMGMIVKAVNLPKFSMDVKAHNAYNRVNLVQNKIKYDPVNITFHDDQSDNVRNFWYDYYSYFYRDSDYADSTYNIIHKYQSRPSFEWGYTPRPVSSYNAANAYQNYQYIQAIRIYSLYQGNFSEYELINPIITSFKHGEHANGENGSLLEHQMSIQFETVKYQTGYTTENTVGGYIDLHYDRITTPNGGTAQADTNSSGVIDLANFNLSTSGGSVIPSPSAGALSASFAFSSISSSVLASSAAGSTNAGGFALPALGSLMSGISSSNIIEQQLKGAAVGLAGQVASTLAGGVISGVASGLGISAGTMTSGLGLLAAGIANPTAAFATLENMAVGSITTAAGQLVNAGAGKATSLISQAISSGVGSVSTAIGDTLSGLKADYQSWSSDISNGAQATFDASGAVDATNLSGWASGGG